MVNRNTKVIVFLMALMLLVTPLISAGFFDDFYARITGKLTTNETSLNITIGNTPPTIPFVFISSPYSPFEGGNKSVVVNFTATDIDGFENIDTSTAEGRLTKSGEPTRLNTSCAVGSNDGADNINFSCGIPLTYFDDAGSWAINVTISDISGATISNTSISLTYSSLLAMVMSPTALSWPGIGPSAINTEANENLTLNNTGNDEGLSINVTGFDLQGESETSQYLLAANFTVNSTGVGGGTCTTTAMANATSINVTNAILQRGDNDLGNGQEELVFCLAEVTTGASSQSYSSAVLGAWVIRVISPS